MKVSGIHAKIGSVVMLVCENDALGGDVVQVADPLAFLKNLGVTEGTIQLNLNGTTPPTKAVRTLSAQEQLDRIQEGRRRGGRAGAKRLWELRRAGAIPPQGKRGPYKKRSSGGGQRAQTKAIEQGFLATSGHPGGRHGPRLGTLHITEEDAAKVREALRRHDNALSPLHRQVLRMRLGEGNQPAIRTKEICDAMHFKDTTQVSRLVIQGLRMLGIRRRKVRAYAR